MRNPGETQITVTIDAGVRDAAKAALRANGLGVKSGVALLLERTAELGRVPFTLDRSPELRGHGLTEEMRSFLGIDDPGWPPTFERTTSMSIRADAATAARAELVLRQYGIPVPCLVRMFLLQCVFEMSVPLELHGCKAADKSTE